MLLQLLEGSTIPQERVKFLGLGREVELLHHHVQVSLLYNHPGTPTQQKAGSSIHSP